MMKISQKSVCIFLSVFFTNIVNVDSLKCYRCTSTEAVEDPYQCNEFFEDSKLEPKSCDDVYNAQYCVKQIGRFEGDEIRCFECDFAWDISCTDMLILDGTLQSQPCDRLYDAQYCIKMTGFLVAWASSEWLESTHLKLNLTGGLGTKRFCSAADLGNYCNYVQQPGDKMEYRSCYFTCTGDGCNAALRLTSLQYIPMILTYFLIYYLL